MKIKPGDVVKVSVIRAETYNGKDVYRVFFDGKYYRVERYPGQPLNKDSIYCICAGTDSSGRLTFEQSKGEIINDLYKEGGIYSFILADESPNYITGVSDYQLEDDYGLLHVVHMRRNLSFVVGERVMARVSAVNPGYLSLQMIPNNTSQPSSSPRGGKVVKKSAPVNSSLDFSKLNPAKDATLRDYQVDNKRKIYEAWQSCRSVMLQMPTGTGKTRLFVSIARDIFDYGASIKKTFKVLILAHRKELIEQISDHLGQKYRLAHGLIISQNIEQKKYSMQVGSVPTLNRRLDRWEDKDFDVIIIDEAHHVKAKSYKKIIDLFPNAKILGVTATPYRLNHAGFRPEFDELIVSPSVAEFIKRGYLCEYDYYSIRPNSELQREIDRMKLDFEGDYKESEMMGVMDRDTIRADILDTYQRYASDKKAIVYTINRDHNVHLAEKFKAAGIVSAAIDSETPKEKRDELVNKFRRGDIQVLFNVNIFSEGFDCPDVEVIQLARPTKSLSMYLQQVGRGLRPAEGKERLLILDNVGLYNKFGFPSARRKWKYHFEGQDVDETPAAHRTDREEQREVKDIVEGSEEVAMLHTSTEEEVATTALDSITRNYKDAFVEFATQKIDAHTVQGYVRNIEKTLDAFIGKWIKPGFKSLFNTVNLGEIEEIRAKLFKSVRFKKLNDEKHHVFSAAFNKYRAFAKWFNEHIPDEPALPDILPGAVTPDMPVDYRPRFKAFLKKDRYSDSGAEQVIKMLTSGVDYYIKKVANPGHKTVFDTSDVGMLTRYYNSLMRNLTFASFNKMKGSRPGSALQKYIAFAKSLEVPATPNVKEKPMLIADAPATPSPSSADEYHPFQEEFEEYLAAKGINRPSVRKYVTMLTEKVNPMIRCLIEPSFISILANDKLDVVRTMYELLDDKKEYKELNDANHNAPDVAFRKYIEFLEERHPTTDDVLPRRGKGKKEAAPGAGSTTADKTSSTVTAGEAATVAEIDASLRELDNLETLLRKNNLPIDPALEERRRRFRAARASLLQEELLLAPIRERLESEGISQIITFKYSNDNPNLHILEPDIDPGIRPSLEEIEQIVTLLSKNGLDVPKYVKDRGVKLSRQLEQDEKVLKFGKWVADHLASAIRGGLKVVCLQYSPRTGLTAKVQADEAIDVQREFKMPDKPFVLDKTSMLSSKLKSALRVTLEDGTVLQKENASDTFIAFVEHIGISKVKSLDIKMYGRHIIDSTPHPRYPKQCKELSDGEYLMVLSTTERKAQIINSIAKYYGLSIKAELIAPNK